MHAYQRCIKVSKGPEAAENLDAPLRRPQRTL